MAIDKLNIQAKVDNAAKKKLVASNEIGKNETLIAEEVNLMVEKVNEVIDYQHESFIVKIDTIAQLRNYEGKEGQVVTLLGYYSKGDKDPLNYKWTSEQGEDDGGSIINSSRGSWEAKFDDIVNILSFGCKGDGIFDNTTNIQNAINTGANIYIPRGTFNHKRLEFSKNSNGSILKGSGLGRSILRYIGESNNTCINFSKETSFISNYVVKDITFNGNDLASDVRFYRNIDLKINNCEFINFIGKSVIVDRSYQIVLSQCKFRISPNVTPQCLLYLATNAVTIDSQCYFNANRRCSAIQLTNNTVDIDARSYKVAITNNVFESASIGVEVLSDSITEGVNIFNNYFELLENNNIPLVIRGGFHKNFSFKDNFINMSTFCSVLIDKVDNRSSFNFDSTTLHRPISILTTRENEDSLDFRSLPSINANSNIARYKMANYGESYLNPSFIIDNKHTFNELNINRISDDIDIRHAEITGKKYVRSESNVITNLLSSYMSPSGGVVYARTLAYDLNINYRIANRNLSNINSITNTYYNIKGVVRHSGIMRNSYNKNILCTEPSNNTDVLINTSNEDNVFSIQGLGDANANVNERQINFNIKMF